MGEGGMAKTELAELRGEIDALRRQMAALVEQVSTEVRTRRLVVVEEDGFERIVAEANGDSGEVKVQSRTATEDTTNVSMFAGEIDGFECAEVGLWHRGNNAAELITHLDTTATIPVPTVELHVCRPHDGSPGMVFNGNGVSMHSARTMAESMLEILEMRALGLSKSAAV